jgi:cytochrome c
MKILATFCCLVFGVSALAMADAPIRYEEGTRLMHRYHCQTCHRAYGSLQGPSFRAIARRYASDPDAVEELEMKVLNGSSGAWGTRFAMPSSEVPPADLHALIRWILSLR